MGASCGHCTCSGRDVPRIRHVATGMRRDPLPYAKIAPMMQCAMGAIYVVMHVCCTYSRYSHSIVKNSLQFVPVCRSLLQFVPFTSSLKNRHESMGSNLGHGFSGHPRRFRGSRWVTANCEQQLLATWTLYFRGGWGRRNSAKPSPSKLARDARSSFAPPRESSCCSVWL